MVAGFAEVIEGKYFVVAGGGFEPPTFGLWVLTETEFQRVSGRGCLFQTV